MICQSEGKVGRVRGKAAGGEPVDCGGKMDKDEDEVLVMGKSTAKLARMARKRQEKEEVKGDGRGVRMVKKREGPKGGVKRLRRFLVNKLPLVLL